MGSVITLWEQGIPFHLLSKKTNKEKFDFLPLFPLLVHHEITNNIPEADISKHFRPQGKRKAWNVQKRLPIGLEPILSALREEDSISAMLNVRSCCVSVCSVKFSLKSIFKHFNKKYISEI